MSGERDVPPPAFYTRKVQGMRVTIAVLCLLVVAEQVSAQSKTPQAPPAYVSLQQAPPVVKPCGCDYTGQCACIRCNCERCACFERCPGKTVAESLWEEWHNGWWRHKKSGAWYHSTQGYFPPGGLYYLEPSANHRPGMHVQFYQPVQYHYQYAAPQVYCGPSG